MKKICLIIYIFLSISNIEAHNFKVGDVWYYNSDGNSVEFKVFKTNEKGALLRGKYKRKDVNLEILTTSENTISARIKVAKGTEKAKIYDFINQAYISKKTNTAITRKPIDVSEIYVNKYLTLKKALYYMSLS